MDSPGCFSLLGMKQRTFKLFKSSEINCVGTNVVLLGNTNVSRDDVKTHAKLAENHDSIYRDGGRENVIIYKHLCVQCQFPLAHQLPALVCVN